MATTTNKNRQVGAARTTVALKTIMALSGLLLVAFLLGHMYGNLKAFNSAHDFNEYAHHLRILGEPILPEEGFLWIFRVVMLIAIAAHIASAMKLWRRNAAARGTRYAVSKPTRRPYVQHIMRWGGVTLIAFIIFHILQFTTNTIRTNGDYDDPYNRMVAGFQTPWVVVFYLIAIALVCWHVAHGVWSSCQTLGFAGKHEKAFTIAGALIALVLFVGFASIPLAVAFGHLTLTV